MVDESDEIAMIQAQLAALDAGSSKRRSRFRLLEVRCSRCGKLIGEVMNTSPEPVLVVRTGNKHQPWEIDPLAIDPTEPGLTPAACCSRHRINRHAVAEAVGRRTPKLVLDPPEQVEGTTSWAKMVTRRAARQMPPEGD